VKVPEIRVGLDELKIDGLPRERFQRFFVGSAPVVRYAFRFDSIGPGSALAAQHWNVEFDRMHRRDDPRARLAQTKREEG